MVSASLAALVDDGAIFTFEAQGHLLDLVGEYESWDVDLQTGVFEFTTPGRLAFGVQLLGSAAEGPRSWLWGWANPSQFPAAVLESANAARELGERYAIPELTSGEIPFSEDDADGDDLSLRVTIAARVASGNWFVYKAAPNPGQRIYMLLTGPMLTLPAPAFPRTLASITEVLSAGLIADARRALASYATLRGLGWDGQRLQLPDGFIDVTVDEAGRITGLSGTAGPGAAPSSGP